MEDQTLPKDEVQQLQMLWEKRIAEGNQRIERMPVNERPREKLLAKGPFALSDLELMAVMIGTGTQSSDVFPMAARILKALDQIDWQPDVKNLLKIAGVGPGKATAVVAAIELSRRRIHPRGLKISSTIDVLPFVRHLGSYKQEHFVCISLNGANEVLATRTVTIGLVDSVLTHAREVFADPITDRATAVILAHNHPSGDVTPSQDDKKVTRHLSVAGKFLGIQLLDHIIFNHKDHYSFLESGELPGTSGDWGH
jgi:DNA repair protein RadC